MAILPFTIYAQKNGWLTFQATFEGVPGIIEVNTSLSRTGPDKMKPFLVMTGVKMNNKKSNGLSSEEETPILLAFQKSVEQLLDNSTHYSLAGSFTHDGVRINYIYLADTVGLRGKLTAMYAQQYPKYTLGLTMKYEKDWDTYFEFLFPGDKVMEEIRKQKQN